MARVTVEDCLENVDNRFELVLLAAKRARQLSRGFVESLVPANGDKPTVIALREIAERGIDKSILDQKEPLKVVVDDNMSEISEEIIAETQQTENDAEEDETDSIGDSDDEGGSDEESEEDIDAEIDAEFAEQEDADVGANADSSDDSEE